MQKAIIRVTSVTYAIRAQKLLEAHGIRSTIKKIVQRARENGCGYGLEISESDYRAATGIISSAGIRILDIIR